MRSNFNCCVCLEGDFLISLSNVCSNNDTIYSALCTLVPEVHWKETFSICSNCLKTLDVVIEFRHLCLKSSSYRVEGKKKLVVGTAGCHIQNEENRDFEIREQYLQDLSEEKVRKNNLNENFEVLCNVCSNKLKSDELLYTHTKGIDKNEHTCSSCLTKNIDQVNQKRNNENLYHKVEYFKQEKVFESHILDQEQLCEVINKPQYDSDNCSKTLCTEIENEQKNIHNEFICFLCNKSYKSKVMLAKHIKLSHQTEKFKCSHCLVIYNTEKSLKEHYKRFHDNSEAISDKKIRLYECSKCKKSYKIEKVMKNHYKICDGMKQHLKVNSNTDFVKNRCETCGRFYTTQKILKAHTKNCNGSKMEEEEIKCKICNTLFTNEQMKLEHVLKEHNVNLNAENICKYCYTQFVSSEEYKDHLVEVHSDDILKKEKRSYSCEVCSKIFRYVKDVIEHCVKEHQMDSKLVKPFLCDKCDTRFTSSANMIQHKQYHEGTRSHICSFCGKSYITKSDLTVHEYTHLNKRNYKCEICDRAFNTNKNLRSHKLVVHTDSILWKYHCNMCDKRFPLKSGYDQHTRRHAGDKRFQCLICLKSFISSSELRKHMTFHSNVKAFKCPHCDKEYKDRRVYEIHLTKIHGIGNAKIPIRVKKFACHICPSTFFDKQKLSRHLCTHTGIKPYACTMCEKRFTDKSYLKHHLKVTHNVVDLQFNDPRDVKIT